MDTWIYTSYNANSIQLKFPQHWNKAVFLCLTIYDPFPSALLTPAKMLIFINRIEIAALLIFRVEFWVTQRLSEVTQNPNAVITEWLFR